MLITAGVLILFAFLIFERTSVVLTASIDENLKFISGTITEVLDTANETFTQKKEWEQLLHEAMENYWIEVSIPKMAYFYASKQAMLSPIDQTKLRTEDEAFEWKTTGMGKSEYYESGPDGHLGLRARTFSTRLENGMSSIIITALPLTQRDMILKKLVHFLMICIVIFLFVLWFSGVLFTRYTLRPLIITTQQINRINGTDLSERKQVFCLKNRHKNLL